MGAIQDAVRRTDEQRRHPGIPEGVQVSAYEVWDREPQTGHPYVLGRISRETGQYGVPEIWVLRLLPDAKYGPDFLLQNDGRFATNAATPTEAQRVLGKACEALQRWLNENHRIKEDAWDNIGKAVVLDRDEPLPLDLGGEYDPRPHSRACGITCGGHGPACSPNCPTCGGKDLQ